MSVKITISVKVGERRGYSVFEVDDEDAEGLDPDAVAATCVMLLTSTDDDEDEALEVEALFRLGGDDDDHGPN